VPASRRDPLSVAYDGAVNGILTRAARASKSGRSVQAWIASPRAEFRQKDRGGRTAHERAFTRAAYYEVSNRPRREGRPIVWSLKLTWGTDAQRSPSANGRLARPVHVRLFPRSEAEIPAQAWTEGHGRSEPGHRIDD
jgi:hypothetical protein